MAIARALILHIWVVGWVRRRIDKPLANNLVSAVTHLFRFKSWVMPDGPKIANVPHSTQLTIALYTFFFLALS
jgi:hypothetical protein